MTTVFFVTASTLFGAAVGALTILIAGIHRDDAAKSLKDAPHSRVEAATRRMLGVGVRSLDSGTSDEEAR